MATNPEDAIQHAQSNARGEFYIEREGRRIAELSYSLAGGDAVVGHTWVDPKHRGGTLAPDLVQAAVAWARAGDRKIIPMCSYVRAVFMRTPHYGDVWKR